jgi:hypothetical protein
VKTTLSAIALATALTLAPFIGGSFAVADDSAQREDHGRLVRKTAPPFSTRASLR